MGKSALQDHGKIIYVLRNPKDALVSLRHHHSNNPSIAWRGNWNDWIEQWVAGERSQEYGGTYFEHVRQWWKLSRLNPGRMHVVCFEDMWKNLGAVASSVGRFLGCEVDAADLAELTSRCSFKEMKQRYSVP